MLVALLLTMAAIIVLMAGIATLVHLLTLPVEWDASFRRALSVLQQGNYLSSDDMRGPAVSSLRPR